MPYCRSRGPLHAHHVIFRSRGGPDDPWNRTTLCDACHALLHDKRTVAIDGRAPHGLIVRIGLRRDGSARETWHGGMRVDVGDADPTHPRGAIVDLAVACA